MINFPANYFEEEIRCGFKVSHMMKCAWAAQLEVLKQIEGICQRHNLQYFAYFGTLLGAVRHKGFIPWDDDMDIAMKRKDYILFLSYAKEELPTEYRILNAYTEDEWVDSFSRITNSDKIDVSQEHLQKFHNCPFAVGIDIFPLDGIPQDTKIADYQMQMLGMARDSYFSILYLRENGEKDLGSKRELGAYKEKLAGDLRILSDFTGIARENTFSLANWVLRMFDAICMIGNDKEAQTIGSFQIHLKHIVTDKVSIQALSFTQEMCFEATRITVPIGYDEVLKNVYKEYRTLKFVPNHEYPFYKKQIPLMQGKHIWDEIELQNEMKRTYPDSLDHYGYEEAEMPMDWLEQWDRAKKLSKKIVLFATSGIDFLMLEERYVTMLMRTLQTVEKEKNKIFLWWVPDNIEKYIYFSMNRENYKKYEACITFFKKNNLGIFDTTKEIVRAINKADFYFGDETVIYERCKQEKKICYLQSRTDLEDILKLQSEI